MTEKSWQTALMRTGEVGRLVLKRDPGHTIDGRVGSITRGGKDVTFRVGGMSEIDIDREDWEFMVEMELLPTAVGSVVYDKLAEVYFMRESNGEWTCSDSYTDHGEPSDFKIPSIEVMFDAADHHKS
jgi:hypothetical protein